MPIVSRSIFQVICCAARKGLREGNATSPEARKHEARQTGIRGETYAYWYLRRHGYIFVTRNFTPRASKGEIDMVGYGETLAFVEVRTRTDRPRRNLRLAGAKRNAGKATSSGSHRATLPCGTPRW